MFGKKWHIELTSKCTLGCPLCDRTWFYNKFKRREIHEINVDKLFNFLSESNTNEVAYVGNNGDPIYHKDFFKVIEKTKQLNAKCTIGTNGSFKTKEWWQTLNGMLTKNFTFEFAIDGLQNTNHLYRINANWNSIMDAVSVLTKDKKCKLIWKFIVFKHNQHQINKAKIMSKKLGFDKFMVIQSNRFSDDESKKFMPDEKYISPQYFSSNQEDKMYPACGNQVTFTFIDSEGYVYPCCLMGSYHYKYRSMWSPKKQAFNIKTHTAKDIFTNLEVKKFYKSTFDISTAHDCCQMHCRINSDESTWMVKKIITA
jgi:MoaA/NifB/PqqE/SkfB family radical SAM enzyme|tara:strand:- start:648 stop:1583 length:936 start_codon:yes stop_codon:yes gene_type:complete